MKNIRIEIKWAILFTIMTLAWMVIEKAIGLHDKHIDKHALYTNLIAIPAIAIYVFALIDKRNNHYNGRMSYKQGFICGVIITVFIALLSPLTQYITSTIITPDYFNNAAGYAVRNNKLSEAQAREFFTLNNYMLQGVLGALMMGIITSAIVAFFTKRKRSADVGVR